MSQIHDIRQIEALVSATRQEILDAMLLVAPASIRQIAELLGRAPDSLYYHFRMLEKVGLIEVAETRSSSRREEAVYDLIGRPTEIDASQDKPRVREAVCKIAATLLRLADRTFRAAVESGQAILHGSRRNVAAGRVTAWLTEDELRKVEQHLTEVGALFRKRRKQGAGKLYSFTYAFSPLEPSRRKSRGGKTPNTKQTEVSQTNTAQTDDVQASTPTQAGPASTSS